MNLPSISTKNLKRRENEAGAAITAVAENVCKKAIAEERNLL